MKEIIKTISTRNSTNGIHDLLTIIKESIKKGATNYDLYTYNGIEELEIYKELTRKEELEHRIKLSLESIAVYKKQIKELDD